MSQIKVILSKNKKWPLVRKILSQIHEKNFEAVLVGGVVRDALLNREIKDFDIATNAKPEDILKIFPNAKDQWKRYGVIFLSVFSDEEPLQITTFRKEKDYNDKRRPDTIEYCSIKEDAKRRDFTINALFFDMRKNQILDFFDGRNDLKKKILRSIGDPKERFNEDYLRPLRALRFSHELNFSIDKKTKDAIPLFSKHLESISQERITSELIKMFSCGNIFQAMSLLNEVNFFSKIFSFKKEEEIDAMSFWNHSFHFYHDESFLWAIVGIPYFLFLENDYKIYLKNLKISSANIKSTLNYMRSVRIVLSKKNSLIDKLKVLDGKIDIIKNIIFALKDLNFKNVKILSKKELNYLFETFQERSDSNGKLKKALITSQDLIQRGCNHKDLSKLLNMIFDYQTENNISNKEDLLNYVSSLNIFPE